MLSIALYWGIWVQLLGDAPKDIGLRIRLEARETMEDDVPLGEDQIPMVFSTDLRPAARLEVTESRYRLELNEIPTFRIFDHKFDTLRVENTLILSGEFDISPRILVTGRMESFLGSSASLIETLGSGALVPIPRRAPAHQELAVANLRYELNPLWGLRLGLKASQRGLIGPQETEEAIAMRRSTLSGEAGVWRDIPRGQLGLSYEHLEISSGLGGARADSFTGELRYDLSRNLSASFHGGLGLSQATTRELFPLLVGGGRLFLDTQWGYASLSFVRRFAELESFAPAASVDEIYGRLEAELSPHLVVAGRAGASQSVPLGNLGQDDQDRLLILVADAGFRTRIVENLWLQARYSFRWQQGSAVDIFDFSRNYVIVGLLTTFGAGHIARSGGVTRGNF